MIVKRNWKRTVPILAILTLSLAVPAWAGGFPGGIRDALGPRYDVAPQLREAPRIRPRPGANSVHHWNEIVINASGLDHTPVAPGENRVFGEQFGPGRSSRAMAIVHIAMFDALDAVVGGCTSYTRTQAAPGPMSVDGAISQAAHDSLAALFPSQ